MVASVLKNEVHVYYEHGHPVRCMFRTGDGTEIEIPDVCGLKRAVRFDTPPQVAIIVFARLVEHEATVEDGR